MSAQQIEEARTKEEEAARLLAEKLGLDYRHAHSLSLDTRAIGVIDRADARRLEVLPFAVSAAGPMFVVAEPTEERLAAVRALAGDNACFSVVSRSTLDALASSRLFNPSPSGKRSIEPMRKAERPPEQPTEEATREPEPSPEIPPEPPERAEPEQAQRPTLVAIDGRGDIETTSGSFDDLLSQLAEGATALTAQVKDLTHDVEDRDREILELRHDLDEAAREHERFRVIIETLREELAKNRAAADSATARLQDVVGAMQAQVEAQARRSEGASDRTSERKQPEKKTGSPKRGRLIA